MNGLFEDAFQSFFVFALFLLFVVAIIILKPFRIHRRRTLTTISLKLSYVLFLGSFLTFTYLLLFGVKQQVDETLPYETLFNKHFLLYLSSTIIPNFGVMARKQIIRKRVLYNKVFTVINILYLSYLLYALLTKKWALM